MNPAKQFSYTLDQPLAPNIPNRMSARKQQAFTDPDTFAHEVTSIFDNDWVMVGRSGSIPNPGDYMTAFIGQRPVIVMRQQDGAIRTMANYCLHRYVKLLEGCGSTKSIVCPYHCWVYKLDGELASVPEREGF
nr:Rieske (2Fe-2S) protein [Leptolyngbyaceae cyanobacterium MAG.088]